MRQIHLIAIMFVLFTKTALSFSTNGETETSLHSSNTAVINLQGYFNGNDGIILHIAQYQDEVFWFGENPNKKIHSHVFSGKISGNRLSGFFFNLPHSNYHGSGQLEFEITPNGKSFKLLKGNYPTSEFTKTYSTPTRKALSNSLTYSQLDNREVLDGIWTTEEGLRYQVRQCGSRIAFFGEQYGQQGGKPNYSIAAVGRRIGDVITVNWGQLPQSTTRENGRASFRVRNNNEITRFSGKGFLGTKLSRLHSDNFNPNKWNKKLNGVYMNEDTKTRGVVKLHFHGEQGQMEVWGSCSPTLCYWGAMFLKSDDTNLSRVNFYTSYISTTMEIETISNTRIKVIRKSTFRDGRKTRSFTEYFDKQGD